MNKKPETITQAVAIGAKRAVRIWGLFAVAWGLTMAFLTVMMVSAPSLFEGVFLPSL